MAKLRRGRLDGAFTVYLLLGLGLLLPALAVVFMLLYSELSGEAADARQRAARAADTLILLSDARAASDLATLRFLAQSRTFRSGDLEAGARRAQEAIELVPGWEALLLTERNTGNSLYFATTDGIEYSPQVSWTTNISDEGWAYGGVEREGHHCPCVTVTTEVPGDGGHLLTVFITPLVYQEMLMQWVPEGAVAAIVDREGEFIARSIDYANRVGTPGTSYVLDAVAEGGSGIYAGTTYEGLANYTAYATSELAGWSSHIAISNTLLDRPLQRAAAVITFGLLAAILAGLGLFALAGREVVRRRKNEEHLLNLQRSQAVAQFTATIVHDFRNVISSLQAGLNLIRRKTKNDEIKSYVGLIEESVSKATRLSNQLLSLSHGRDTELESVDVSEMLSGLRYLLEQAAGEGVVLSIVETESHLSVVANRDQLELALLNLVVNARDALEGRGRITVEASVVGARVEIVVSDNGPGVPAKLEPSLFQPFVTDKPQGSGLGLAQVAVKARNAGGEGALENVSEGGARFVIRLNQGTTFEKARGGKL